MTKIILNNGDVEFLSAGAAREKVAAGKAKFPKATPYYSTRQIVAEVPEKQPRKRRTKAEMEADRAGSNETE